MSSISSGDVVEIGLINEIPTTPTVGRTCTPHDTHSHTYMYVDVSTHMASYWIVQ